MPRSFPGKSGSTVNQTAAEYVVERSFVVSDGLLLAASGVPGTAEGRTPGTPEAAPPRSGGLGNPGINSSAIPSTAPVFASNDGRRERYRRRKIAATIERERWNAVGASLPIISCGHAREDVGIRRSDTGSSTHVGVAGTQSCGSSWVCPTCAYKIGRYRNEEVGHVLGWARREQKSLGFLTLTIRHKAGQRLKDVWDGVSHGWASVTSGSAWKSESEAAFLERSSRWWIQGTQADQDKAEGLKVRDGAQRAPRGWKAAQEPERRIGDQEAYGIAGWIRVTEVTHGKNGWHVHLHVPLILEQRLTEDQFNELESRIWERWEAGIQRKGFTAEKKHGIKLEPFSAASRKTLADYLTKASSDSQRDEITASLEKKGRDIAREVTGAATKEARKGRTPFQILDDAEHDLSSKSVWLDWTRDSLGRRQIAWSKGLREATGLGDELTNEEVAEIEIGKQRDTVARVSQHIWNDQCKDRVALILDAAQHSPEVLFRFFQHHGIAYEVGSGISNEVAELRTEDRIRRRDHRTLREESAIAEPVLSEDQKAERKDRRNQRWSNRQKLEKGHHVLRSRVQNETRARIAA